MAWNPSPKVAAARDIGKRFDQDQVIIVMLSRREETICATSYGRTKQLCEAAKPLMDAAYAAVLDKFREEDKQ